MSVSFKDFMSFVKMICDARFPVMIRGQHGVGKSQLVYQYAKRAGLPVVERRASQMTEGDLVGLPVVKGDATSWNPPDWYKQACSEPVVLFMDEIDRATTEVRQGFFQLADSRALNGHRLHPDTILFAAVNGGKHGSKYQVNDMDPAELDRWTVFDVEPTVEDWLSYAADGERINPIITDFIRHNHTHLENKRDFEPGKVYPSRRSWERLSDTVNGGRLLEGNYKGNLATLFNIATGFVGFEAAVALKDHAEKYENMVTPQDILDGKIDKLKGWKLNDHVAMIEKMLVPGVLHATIEHDKIENLGRYFMILPSEAAMKFYTGLSATKELMPLIVAFHKLTVDGVSLKAHMTKMLQKK
jgi:AAA domain (dynein-related subfamily)